MLGVGGYYGYQWWTTGRFMISTDDAYIQADVATLGVKVAGYVARVDVKDGDAVKAGDVLVKLDDTDYRLALDSAAAKRATQGATIARIARQVTAQQAQIDSARAGIVSAEAEQTRSAAAYERAQSLAQQNFQSKAVLDQTVSDRDRAVAAVNTAKAALAAAEANLDVIAAQKAEAEQVAKELDTAVDKARSDLAFTEIRAPSDGVVGNRAAQPGQYVAPGSRLMALVPLASVYIAANFKETQLAELRPGQSVDVSVDSMAGHSFTAHGRAALRRPPARSSACCRPRTPPATSPRSSSACRCGSRCRPTSPRRAFCAPASRSSSPSTRAPDGSTARANRAVPPARRGRSDAPRRRPEPPPSILKRPPWPPPP